MLGMGSQPDSLMMEINWDIAEPVFTVALMHSAVSSLTSCLLSLVTGGLTYPAGAGAGGVGAGGVKPPKPGRVTGLLLSQHKETLTFPDKLLECV